MMRPMRLLPIVAVALSIAILPISILGQEAGAAGEKLGRVSFPVSCPAVQKPFERAVALLHSFWYLESLKAFTAVTQTDPDCAMGYWGIAMSLWYQIWSPPRPAALKQGWEAIEKATALGGKTQRERDFIAAAAAFFQDHDTLHEYEASLRLAPNRFRAFYGAAKAAELSGDRETAKTYYGKLLSVAAPASDRTELTEAKAFRSGK